MPGPSKPIQAAMSRWNPFFFFFFVERNTGRQLIRSASPVRFFLAAHAGNRKVVTPRDSRLRTPVSGSVGLRFLSVARYRRGSIPTKTLDCRICVSCRFSASIKTRFHVLRTSLKFEARFPNLCRSVRSRSKRKRWFIQLNHLLCISRSEKYFVGSLPLSMTRVHRSFQIRCAVSEIRIRNSRSAPLSGLPLAVLKCASPQAKMLPKFISGQSCPVISQSSRAKFHNVSRPGASHSIRMCSIESSTSQ
jgi:hypothetical protein